MLKKSIELDKKEKYVEEYNAQALPIHSNPLVSAIITTHNREPGMVLRAVNSVLNQTYQNIELIVVDDSSPSFTRRTEVEQSVRGISDGILYLKHEFCQGACAARNSGLSHAKGDYVGFLDDDDEWLPSKIEEQLKGFIDDNIALVYNPMIILDEKINRTYISRSRGESGYVFETLIKSNYIGSTSNPLIKKECIESVGTFDVQMESYQDYDLYLRLALKYLIQYIDEPLIKYHIHSGKRISTDAEKKIEGGEQLILKYEEYINKDNDTWYMRHRGLIPFYLEQYGRKKALDILISCFKKRPGYCMSNSKLLGRIILGNDLYMQLVTQYHMFCLPE